MAEKSFGVKEINLIGASGTPTIESPNNLNLNAVNVAISTNATIGGNLTVTGNIGIAGTLTYEDVTNVDSIGIVTAREGIKIPDDKEITFGAGGDGFIKSDGANFLIQGGGGGTGTTYVRGRTLRLSANGGSGGYNGAVTIDKSGDERVQLKYGSGTKLVTTSSGITVTGTVAATAVTGDGSGLTNLPVGDPADTDPQIVFDISASGSSGYIFTGPGNDGSTVNPDIYLMRGQRYRFINTTGSSHPFEFRNADNNADFTDGITGSQSGTQDFNVQYDAPAHLKYRCTIHTGSMVGNIYIRSGADTGASAGTENIEIGGFLRFDNTVSKIVTDTSDGSDDKAIFITGGGDTATTRGALAVLYGNELNSGRLDLYSGVGGGDITFNTGTTTTEKLRIKSNGIIVAGNSGTPYGNALIQSFIAHGSTAGESAFSAVDTTSVAAGVGGEIAFHGKFNTGAQDYAYLGHIRGIKENATNGNTACALTFHTRPTATAPQERLRINSSGQALLGAGAIATTKVTQSGSLDLDSGGISLCIGGNVNSSGRTNSTDKINRITSPHYTNAEEPVMMLSAYNQSGNNTIGYGGGSGLTNAVTRHSFYTAANTTTTTGTERIRLVSDGKMLVGEANTSPVSDLEVRRANNGGDVSIRIGNNTGTNAGSTASLYFTTSPTQTFNTSYIQAVRDGGKLNFGYSTNAPTVTMHVSQNKVGIGTENPTTALEVKGDITVSNANNQADIFFGEHGDVSDSKALIRMDQLSSTAGQLQFHTESGGTLAERFRIESNGFITNTYKPVLTAQNTVVTDSTADRFVIGLPNTSRMFRITGSFHFDGAGTGTIWGDFGDWSDSHSPNLEGFSNVWREAAGGPQYQDNVSGRYFRVATPFDFASLEVTYDILITAKAFNGGARPGIHGHIRWTWNGIGNALTVFSYQDTSASGTDRLNSFAWDIDGVTGSSGTGRHHYVIEQYPLT